MRSTCGVLGRDWGARCPAGSRKTACEGCARPAQLRSPGARAALTACGAEAGVGREKVERRGSMAWRRWADRHRGRGGRLTARYQGGRHPRPGGLT